MIRVTNAEIARLAEYFTGAPRVFTTSPLYRALCPAVAADPFVLALLAGRRDGQQPSYLLFGAVHHLVLAGASHPLREFFPSVAGDAARDPALAGPVLRDFCRAYHDDLATLISTRLVQTNVVRRVIALRVALAAIGGTEPVHLIEVGASAGMLLLVDRYRYRIGDHTYGPADARVIVDTEWRGTGPPPDLDRVPPIASRIGIDLHPVDVTDADRRSWLRALVWPEDHGEAALLDAALAEVAADPPTVITGDAIDVCPELGRTLPAGQPRVVFHAATRMHVPLDRRAAFDAAIDSIGERGPLWHVWLESADAQHHGRPALDNGVVAYHGPGDDGVRALVRADGHLHWLAPVVDLRRVRPS